MTPAIARSEPFGLAGSDGPAGVAVGVDVPEQDLPVALELVERRVVGEVAALAVGDRHPQRSPRPRHARVNGVSSRWAAIATSRPTNRSDRLRSSAPGTRPASARTWKPLQMPRTRPPSAANAATLRMTGLNRAMTPART